MNEAAIAPVVAMYALSYAACLAPFFVAWMIVADATPRHWGDRS